MTINKYNKDLSYSYIFGAFGTILLLENRPSDVLCVLVASSFKNNEAYSKIEALCKKNKIALLVDDKQVDNLKDKGNIYVIGVFKKKLYDINDDNHLVIYGINDTGLIGTIIRSMSGFNFKNLVLVNCNVDVFNEHLIRSTMGAFFNTNIKEYDKIETYINDYKNHSFYLINSTGKDISTIKKNKVSLIFANKKISSNNIEDIKCDKDISLENIVNIVLFSMYNN